MAEKPTIHELMGKVLAELPAIGKNQKNQQQGFMFRGYDDVLNALNPILSKHGIFILPDVVERVEAERPTARGGVMYVVNLHVRFRFYGPAGDCVEASGWGEGTDSGDKATNKAMTGAFKYVLFQSFAISTQEASDADSGTPEPTLYQGRPQAPRPQQSRPAVRAVPAEQPEENAPFEAPVHPDFAGGPPATEPQKKAIWAISKKKNLAMPERDSMTKAEAGAWIEANGDSA